MKTPATQAAKPAAHRERAAPAIGMTVTPLPTSEAWLQRQSCACGGECPRCRNETGLQTQLAVSTPGDRYEQEADRVAEQVMRLPDPPPGRSTARAAAPEAPASSRTPTLARVACSTCGGSVQSTDAAAPPVVSDVLRAPGEPVNAATRAFMEPRFGHDFGGVRVHTGVRAAESARAVGALAYTVGSKVVFGAGQYAPGTASGRRLLAHELAHVVQQNAGGQTRLARTAGPGSFACPANTNNAPASPFGAIDAVDRHAQGLAGATSILATVASVLDPSTGFGGVDQSYRARFGTPSPRGSRFVNRFTGALRPTRAEAAQEEMTEIGDRLERIKDFLAGPIRYTCQRPNVQFRHSNCVSTCRAGDVAFSCVPQDLRRIEICPGFWGLTDRQQAIAVIHEAVHMLLDFPSHGSASRAARGRNPECYASFVADIFNITPFDTRCPALP